MTAPLSPWAHQLIFIEDDRVWSCPQCGLVLRLVAAPNGVGVAVEVITEGSHPVEDHYHGGRPPPSSGIRRAFERIAREMR